MSMQQDMDILVDEIGSSKKSALHTTSPNVVEVKQKNPWDDQVLCDMLKQQKHTSKEKLRSLQHNIKRMRKHFKNVYYRAKADEINSAAEARFVENEFRLAKKYSMYQCSSRITIPKTKLAVHFKQHFSARPLPLPPELEDTANYPHLTDDVIPIDETAPTEEELENVISKMKNNT